MSTLANWLQQQREFRRFVSPRYAFSYRPRFLYPRGWSKSTRELLYCGERPNQSLAFFMGRPKDHLRSHTIQLSFRATAASVDLDQWLEEWEGRIYAPQNEGAFHVESKVKSTCGAFPAATMETTTRRSPELGIEGAIYKRWMVVSAPWNPPDERELHMFFLLVCSCDTRERTIWGERFRKITDSFRLK